MPVSRAELIAEFAIHPFVEGGKEPHVEAGATGARESRLAKGGWARWEQRCRGRAPKYLTVSTRCCEPPSTWVPRRCTSKSRCRLA
jgi:hypothetical protein